MTVIKATAKKSASSEEKALPIGRDSEKTNGTLSELERIMPLSPIMRKNTAGYSEVKVGLPEERRKHPPSRRKQSRQYPQRKQRPTKQGRVNIRYSQSSAPSA